MNLAFLTEKLSAYQKKLLSLCEKYPEDFKRQYHPDLSPLGWHLGHCVYTEIYWIREQLLGQAVTDKKLDLHYVPELAKKSERGEALPKHADLCQWARDIQKENLQLISQYQHSHSNTHPLMQNHFLLHFLIQHHAQHVETIYMILLQRALQNSEDFNVQLPLTSSEINTSTVVLNAGIYTIGSRTDFLPYDNEYPPFEFKTGDIKIADKPINNSEFLLFMEESGYQKQEFWSQEGWQWNENQVDDPCPEYWLKDNQQNWFGVDINGPHDLDPEHPVWGINYFEAQALANWITANFSHKHARLLHECEWEAAKQNNCLSNTGQVWEWCQNSFYPYPGFEAFPYEGYSVPYFDNSHFVMKGASRYTQDAIQRASFRNYYQPDKRHQFAGCRLIFE